MMDYLDSKKDRFVRGAPCYTPVPGINVVVEGHYAWALPLIAAGIATNRAGKRRWFTDRRTRPCAASPAL